MPRTASSAALTLARARCAQALDAAKEADGELSGLWHRYFVETVTAASGQPAVRSVVMWTRLAILFEVVADRRRWPERMR
jgi:hypothetical protein